MSSSEPRRFLAFVANLIKKGLDEKTPERPELPELATSSSLPGVSKARHALEDGGTSAFMHWLSSSTRLAIVDTSLDRLQSPALSHPIRTAELAAMAGDAVRAAPELNILQVTSPDAAGSALGALECPFGRIEALRQAAPGLVLRGLLSAASGIGPTAAPRRTLSLTASALVDAGLDIIRVADPYDDKDRLSAAIGAALSSNAVVEGAVTVGQALKPATTQQLIDRTVATARNLEANGAHAIALVDGFGFLRPVGAYTMVRAIRREVDIPVWADVADSCGFGLATLIAAVEAGAVGADTVLPCLAGRGVAPDSVALTGALSDTERKPEVDAVALAMLDTRVGRRVERLGSWHSPGPLPPDAPDRGVTAMAVDLVQRRCGGASEVSRDHVLAACEAARKALGNPATVPPATRAISDLATEIIKEGEAAGPLIDRARVDDPAGLFDHMGSLREGGFPEATIDVRLPENRNQLLDLLWGETAAKYFGFKEHFGLLELVPSEPLRYGLVTGQGFEGVLDGQLQHVRLLSVDSEEATAQVEINGDSVEISLATEEP